MQRGGQRQQNREHQLSEKKNFASGLSGNATVEARRRRAASDVEKTVVQIVLGRPALVSNRRTAVAKKRTPKSDF